MRYDINDHPRRRRTDQYEDECPMTPEQIRIMLDRQEQLINDVAEIKKYLFAGRIVVGTLVVIGLTLDWTRDHIGVFKAWISSK